MRAPLIIATSREFWTRIKWISIAVAPFVALGIANVVHDWNRGPHQRETAIYMVFITLFIACAPLFLLWARTRWVVRLDAEGVQLRSGRRFAWRDYQGIERVKNRRLRIINNYELQFTTGKAGVYHLMAANYDELMHVIQALEAGVNPWAPPPS